MRAQPAATSAHDPHPALAEAGPAKLARMSRVEPETPAQSMRPGLAEAGSAAAVPLLGGERGHAAHARSPRSHERRARRRGVAVCALATARGALVEGRLQRAVCSGYMSHTHQIESFTEKGQGLCIGVE